MNNFFDDIFGEIFGKPKNTQNTQSTRPSYHTVKNADGRQIGFISTDKLLRAIDALPNKIKYDADHLWYTVHGNSPIRAGDSGSIYLLLHPGYKIEVQSRQLEY